MELTRSRFSRISLSVRSKCCSSGYVSGGPAQNLDAFVEVGFGLHVAIHFGDEGGPLLPLRSSMSNFKAWNKAWPGCFVSASSVISSARSKLPSASMRRASAYAAMLASCSEANLVIETLVRRAALGGRDFRSALFEIQHALQFAERGGEIDFSYASIADW